MVDLVEGLFSIQWNQQLFITLHDVPMIYFDYCMPSLFTWLPPWTSLQKRSFQQLASSRGTDHLIYTNIRQEHLSENHHLEFLPECS